MTTSLPGDVLDYYLSLGYYRMQQDLFTCRFLPMSDRLHTVHWLRLVLARAQLGPRQRQLARLNVAVLVAARPLPTHGGVRSPVCLLHGRRWISKPRPRLKPCWLDGAAIPFLIPR
ncbi:MAG: hypothetical protein WKG07_08385 [Hymenobacter sp.]